MADFFPEREIWVRGAATLSRLFPWTQCPPEIRHLLSKEPFLPLAVGVSGGADSVVLGLLIWHKFGLKDRGVAFLHYNHGTRGPAARQDALFVGKLAATLGVPFLGGGPPRRPAKPAKPSEEQLRDLRFAFFGRCLRKLNTRYLLLGHTLSDVAETLLLRLSRGSTWEGLAAPRAVSRIGTDEYRLRPLLGLTREEVRSALVQSGLPWREDSSNLDSAYLRNRLRSHVLPSLEAALGQSWQHGWGRSRRLLEEASDALSSYADLLLEGPCVQDERIDLRCLPTAPPRAVARLLLLRWIARQDPSLPGRLRPTACDKFLTSWLAGETAGLTLGSAQRNLRCAEGVVILGPEPGAVPGGRPDWTPRLCRPGYWYRLPGGRVRIRRLRLPVKERVKICAGQVDSARHAYLALDAHKLSPSEIWIRPWLPGDRYRPMGHPGSAKLQDLFTNRKIPVAQRRRLPVFTDREGEILWVPGLAPRFGREISDSSEVCLQLTYEED